MWSSRLVAVVSLLLLLLVHTSQGGGLVKFGNRGQKQQQPVKKKFLPHYHDLTFNQFLGPPQDINEWQQDIEHLVLEGSFIVVVHGVFGSGKSRFIEGLLNFDEGKISGKVEFTKHASAGASTSSSASPGSKSIFGVTRQCTIYDDIGTEDKTRVLFLADTPGFGERDEDGQKMVAKSFDKGIEKIRQTDSPIKRVLYMLDFAKAREPVPAMLKEHLEVLRLAYGSELAPHFRFIISKCDQLKFDKDEFTAAKTNLARLFQESFGVKMDPDSVLFISTESEMVCYRHFTIDLNRVGAGNGFKLQYDRAAETPYAKALLKFSKHVKPIVAKYQHFHDSTEWLYKQSDQLKCDHIVELSVDVSSILKLGESIKDAQEKTISFIAFLEGYIKAQEEALNRVENCEDCDCAEQARDLYKKRKDMAETDLASTMKEYKAISTLPTCSLAHFG